MAAISTAIMAGSAVLSAGVGLYGMQQQNQARDASVAAAQQQSAIAAQQAAKSAEYARREAGINIDTSKASFEAASASNEINKNIIAGEQGAEEQRRLTMEFSYDQAQRSIIRNQQRNRAMGLTTAVAQGANRGQSTALAGAYGQFSGQANTGLRANDVNVGIGRNLFAINRGISEQKIGMLDLQTSFASKSAEFQTKLAELKSEYADVQAGLNTQSSAASSQLATAQGQMGYGNSLVGAAGNIFQIGQVGARVGSSLFNSSSSTPSYSQPGGYGFVG